MMTTEERITLFQRAVLAIEKLELEYPSYPPFMSIRSQRLFLLDQASGSPANREKLSRVNLGYVTMREVEARDAAAADLFYLISAEVKEMLREVSATCCIFAASVGWLPLAPPARRHFLPACDPGGASYSAFLDGVSERCGTLVYPSSQT